MCGIAHKKEGLTIAPHVCITSQPDPMGITVIYDVSATLINPLIF